MRSNDARAAERDRQMSVTTTTTTTTPATTTTAAAATTTVREMSVRVEWQVVATVVDRVFLIIFVATTVGVTMTMVVGIH